MHCGNWRANFVEQDLCSGCGGGGPGIHHRSAGDGTLLVCCTYFYTLLGHQGYHTNVSEQTGGIYNS